CSFCGDTSLALGSRSQPGREGSLFHPPAWPLRTHVFQGLAHQTLLPNGVTIGTVIKIRGVVLCRAGKFSVILRSTCGPCDDYVLHFHPRLDQCVVVFNSREHGSWGLEEFGSGRPFQAGQPFKLLLIVQEDGFEGWGPRPRSLLQLGKARKVLRGARVRLLEVRGDLLLESVPVF
ncbi:hypothetical protein MC885_019518, partial [Smutsia gigantea]